MTFWLAAAGATMAMAVSCASKKTAAERAAESFLAAAVGQRDIGALWSAMDPSLKETYARSVRERLQHMGHACVERHYGAELAALTALDDAELVRRVDAVDRSSRREDWSITGVEQSADRARIAFEADGFSCWLELRKRSSWGVTDSSCDSKPLSRGPLGLMLRRPVTSAPMPDLDLYYLVTEVEPGSPADGHLEPGDILLALNGAPLLAGGRQYTSLAEAIQKTGGAPITLEVRRGDTIREVQIAARRGEDTDRLGIRIRDQPRCER